MKPSLEKVYPDFDHSFKIKKECTPYLDYPWHYHPEFELVLITKGSGHRVVGDSIANFEAGDMVLLGANLPHVWINSKVHYKNNPDIISEVLVIQFSENIFGANFINLPELNTIRKLLDGAKQGVYISKRTSEIIKLKMLEMLKIEGAKKLILLLDILETISIANDIELLSSEGFLGIITDKTGERINKVFSYISKNFMNNIELEEIAKLANMNKASFCRFFKDKTKKTFSEYINEMRIGYARKLLLENKLNVSQICFECGFNSPSYFIQNFKKVIGKTPMEYQNDCIELFKLGSKCI